MSEKRALVLGGGGLWGAFEAGAYSVIEKHFAFDTIVGASAGALNACAIAGGMSGKDLEQLWLSSEPAATLKLHFPRYFLDGFADTTILETTIRDMMRNYQPKKQLGVVVSQGWGLKQVLITKNITPDSILASCAIPFVLPAKRLDGVLSVDGGLRDPCPIFAAREMGATEILAVNVWTHLPWWWYGWGREKRQRTGAIIEPLQRLGPLRTSAIWDTADIERWIAEGRAAARAYFARQ